MAGDAGRWRFAMAFAATGTGLAVAAGATTVDRTIADNRLEHTDGDAYLTRAELGARTTADAGQTLLTFGQLTDLHIVDEESPARVEFLDRLGPPLTSAYRPQQGMTTQVVDEMVRQMRDAVSPVSGRRAQLIISTGDDTDNTQCNETRWLVDILDGEANADAGSGDRRSCVPAGLRPRGDASRASVRSGRPIKRASTSSPPPATANRMPAPSSGGRSSSPILIATHVLDQISTRDA